MVVTVDATTVLVTVDGTMEIQEQALERRTGRGVEVATGTARRCGREQLGLGMLK
jgi:hypothetical protein